MGLIKIRDRDVQLALDSSLRDPVLDEKWSSDGDAERLKQHYRRVWRDLGVEEAHKSSTLGRLSRMSTTYFSQVRLGTGYQHAKPEWQAVTDAHETYHVKQWRQHGRTVFRTRYLFWTRWRWAIEVQAYAESVRALVALGASGTTIREYIAGKPELLWESYALKALRKKDVWAYTIFVLQRAWDEAEARA